MKKSLYVACLTALALIVLKDVIVVAKIRNSSPASKSQSVQSSRRSKPSASSPYKTVRITDSADGDTSIVTHSDNSSFNLDSTRFIVTIDGIANLFAFDPERFSVRKEGILFNSSMPQFDVFTWSSDDPDTLICLSDMRNAQNAVQLYSYNVASRELRLIKDFSGVISSGQIRLLSKSQSDDSHIVFAWRESSSLPWHNVLVWDSATDKTYTFDLTDPISGVPGFTGAHLDKTGQTLIVSGEFSRRWQYKTQPQHFSQRTGNNLTGLSQLYATSSSSADFQIEDSSSVFATNKYMYIGAEPVTLSKGAWGKVSGTAVYRRSISSTETETTAEVAFLSWKGQELLQGDSAELGPGMWHFDNATSELYLRLPSDSSPSQDATLIIGTRKALDIEVIRLARNTASPAETLSEQTHEWTNAPQLRGNVSPDGRFFIFSSKTDGKRSDVFLTALTTQASTEEAIEWTNAINCTVNDNTLVKSAGTGEAEDAGALSLQTIESGDGYVQFTATEKKSNRFLGLTTHLSALPGSAEIDFGIRLNSNKKAEITEKGVVRKRVKYGVGNTFRVSVQGGVIKYYKNAKLIYTSSESLSYPLVTAAGLVSSSARIDSAVIVGAATKARVTINPTKITLSTGESKQFTSTVTGSKDTRVVWTATGGTVSGNGFYTAPATPGTFNIEVTLVADSSVNASAVVTVSSASDTTPPAISQVAATGITASSATVTWITNEPSDTQVEYGLSTSYGSSSPLNTTLVTNHTVTLTGLSPNTTYNFRVKSSDASGNPATSANFTLRTSGTSDVTAPAVSSITVINVSDISATITWTTNEASDSQVDYGTTTSYGTSTPLPTPLLTNHSVTLSNLSPGTTYNYRAKSRDASSNLGVSGNFTFTTAASGSATSAVLAYAFNEGSGSVAFDASSNHRDGTISGATWTTQGKYGNALSFDGVNDKVNQSPMTLGTRFTLMAWVRNPSHSSLETIVSIGRTRDLHLRNGAVAFRFSASTRTFGSAIPTNSWQHVAVTYDGSKLRAYLNGASRGSALSVSLSALTDSLKVGTVSDNNVETEFFSGLIDEVQIFDSALSAAEIVSVMNTPIGGGTAPPADTTPPVVSAVAASSVTSSSATVSWTTNEASDTQVDYGTTTSYGSSSPLNTSLVTSHSAALSGLAAGTTYNYRVRSRDTAGNLAVSTNRTFTTSAAPDTTPPSISQVTASGITTSGATITWTTNEASNTQVEYGTTTSYGSSSPLNTALVTAHSASLTGLAPSTTYNYRVKSRDAAGNLATSGNFTFVTAAVPDTTPPVISSINATGITANGATVTWTTNESSDSQVEYGTTTSYGSSTPLPTPLVTSHSVSLTGLSAGITYNYRVRSRDGAGNLSVSTNRTFTTSAAPPPPSTAGLVAAYNFNEGSGSTVSDASGNAHNGNIAGATWTTAGRYGNALSFDGTNDMITIADSNLLDLSSTLTLSAWINAATLAGTRDILLKEGSGVDLYNLYASNSGGNPESNVFVGGTNMTAIGQALTTNTWIHVAGTYDGTTLRLFVNGVQTASRAASGAIPASAGALCIGGNNIWGEFFQGRIDDVRIYNRVLSASEIQADMNTPVGGGSTAPPADTTPPSISGVGASSVTSSGATVSWTTNEASNTQVDYGTTTSYGSSTPLNTSLVTSHSAALSGLAAGTTYNYRVRSRDAAGNLAISGNFTFTTSAGADTTPPAISSVSASGITSNSATVSWTTNEASNTQVDYGTTTSYGNSTPLNTSLVTSHSASLTGLSANTTYNYRVKSRDAAGNLATSGNFTFTTSASAPPPPSGCPGFVIEGFGQNTVGGCGGTTIFVTNLNDSGTGSLRDALGKTGPRIIKFAVSGTITLSREIEILNPNVTIDGSDAPNGGICIRGEAVRVRTSQVIVRYVRFRRGPAPDPVDTDSFAIQGFGGNPARNIVIDHCSFSWGDDGNLDITSNSTDITVQWCIIAENLGPGNMLIGSGGEGASGSGATRWTVHHNLFTNGGRNPEINTGEAQWINNVVYRNASPGIFDYFQNVGATISPYDTPAPRVNIIGNYFRAGTLEALGEPRNQKQIYFYGGLPQSASALIYVKGNIGPARPNDSLPESDIYYQNDGGVAVTTDAQTAYNAVLNGAGATKPCRDSVDTRIVNDVINRTGPYLLEQNFNYTWPNLSQPCGSSSQALLSPAVESGDTTKDKLASATAASRPKLLADGVGDFASQIGARFSKRSVEPDDGRILIPGLLNRRNYFFRDEIIDRRPFRFSTSRAG